MVRLSSTRPALIVVASSCRGHPLRGRAGPRATSFRLLSCLPTALRCQMDETGTSVRHRFIGSFRTNHCLPSSTYMGCRTLTTMAGREFKCRKHYCRPASPEQHSRTLVATAPLAERHASALHRHRAECPASRPADAASARKRPCRSGSGGSRRFSWTRR